MERVESKPSNPKPPQVLVDDGTDKPVDQISELPAVDNTLPMLLPVPPRSLPLPMLSPIPRLLPRPPPHNDWDCCGRMPMPVLLPEESGCCMSQMPPTVPTATLLVPPPPPTPSWSCGCCCCCTCRGVVVVPVEPHGPESGSMLPNE